MKPFAEKFYNSKRWRVCRNAYIEQRLQIDGGRCEECVRQYQQGLIKEEDINHGFIVHHKVALTEDNINDPNIALSFENLEYDCKTCHDNFEGHGIGKRAERLRVSFDKNGQPIL